MIVPVYTPGDWVAVVTDGAVALLPPTIDEDRLTQVWDALRESSDLTHSLTVLARGGLVGLPPFALVSVVDGHVRGFLRGDVRLFTADADGTHEHSAAHVATWAEINVADAGAVTVAVPAQVAPERRGPRMPALAAVVRASSVEVSLRAGVEAPSPVPPVREPAAGAPAASETTTKDGLDADALSVLDGIDSEQDVDRVLQALREADEPPTAVFSARNVITLGVVRALQTRGLQREIALIGFDDFDHADLLDPAVSAVRQDPAGLGRRATERLFARLDDPTLPVERLVSSTQLILRRSCGCGG